MGFQVNWEDKKQEQETEPVSDPVEALINDQAYPYGGG